MSVRVALLGGVPAVLGGGGLEIQLEETANALRLAGCQVSRGEPADVDVIHLFGAEPSGWHWLQHWIRNPVPLVVSPVLASSSRLSRMRQSFVSRAVPFGTPTRMRREVLDRSSAVIALTGHESDQLRRTYGVPGKKLVTLGNGSDARSRAERAPAEGWVIQVGTVTGHKRQVEIAESLVSLGVGCRIAGGADAEHSSVLERLARSNPSIQWCGHLPRTEVLRMTARASALVLFSVGEGQSLGVLDALALGIPVILSDIPVHRELAQVCTGHVRVIRTLDELGAGLEWAKAARQLPPPAIMTWSDVAGHLISLYQRLCSGESDSLGG